MRYQSPAASDQRRGASREVLPHAERGQLGVKRRQAAALHRLSRSGERVKGPNHENRRRGHRIRGTGHGHVPGRNGQRRDLRRLRPEEDRRAQPRPRPDLRAGTGRTGRPQRGRRAAALHHRSAGGGEEGPAGVSGRGHAAGRRRLGRPLGPLGGRRSDRPAPCARRDRRLQEHRAGGHQRQGGRAAQGVDRPRGRRGQQSRVSQGRDGDRRFHEARPRGRGRPAATRWPTCWPTCISPTCGPTSRFWPCRPRAPR